MSLLEYYNKKTKTLTLPYDFNKVLKGLPTDLKIIIFQEDYDKKQYSIFNQSVNNLPSSLTHLTFGLKFDQSVHNLPSSLTHLTFGWQFNQSVDNLPKNITHLIFGNNFNQLVDNLPSSLTHLTFGFYFNQSIINLPKTIIELGFWSHHKLKNNIPVHVEKVKIYFVDDDKYNETIDNLPSTIKQIEINNKYKVHFIKKIPFECKILDNKDNEIIL